MRITSTFTGGVSFISDIRGHQITVDVPRELGGVDAGPMPPELLATALGTCVGIYAAQFCVKHNISTEGLQIHTDWTKVTDPTRIGSLAVTVELPAGVPAEKYGAFMKTVEQCMVHNTFHHLPDISINVADLTLAGE